MYDEYEECDLLIYVYVVFFSWLFMSLDVDI